MTILITHEMVREKVKKVFGQGDTFTPTELGMKLGLPYERVSSRMNHHIKKMLADRFIRMGGYKGHYFINEETTNDQ